MKLHTTEDFMNYFNKLSVQLGGKGKADGIISYVLKISPETVKKWRDTRVVSQVNLMAINYAISQGELPE